VTAVPSDPPPGAVAKVSEAASPPPAPPPPAPPKEEEPEEDEEGMLRMSFLEHLEELRKRLILALAGLGVAFFTSLTFSERLWRIVQQPATAALTTLGYKDTALVTTSPMESFSIIWVKLPLLTSLFLASPWLLFQVWSFVAPGLYKRERRFAAPFIISAAGLFIAGGLFAYYVAFRFGLTFLLGIAQSVDVKPMITITEYFDIFVNVILGIGVVFELPVLIFFLTLLRIASPRFLFAHSRYAVLAIVILAAVITPTPDVVNLMLFSVPMVVLYFVGVFASYLLVLSRENKRFPWRTLLIAVLIPLALITGALYLAITRYGYKLVLSWPFLTK
jgi:sec-independent protein translocase protein TatC